MLLRGVIFQFRGQISKKVAGHFEEHKKLGRQPNFQKFLATRGLVIPRRRLIGGCDDSSVLNSAGDQIKSHLLNGSVTPIYEIIKSFIINSNFKIF